eukprot:GDKJ01032063.1.p1 GENE.GDKJ01032063.1~~GDKJ01032063.1.p1  ORF type:complete len:201 (+),score=43.60 GDKJ01032063.1:28-630(+)
MSDAQSENDLYMVSYLEKVAALSESLVHSLNENVTNAHPRMAAQHIWISRVKKQLRPLIDQSLNGSSTSSERRHFISCTVPLLIDMGWDDVVSDEEYFDDHSSIKNVIYDDGNPISRRNDAKPTEHLLPHLDFSQLHFLSNPQSKESNIARIPVEKSCDVESLACSTASQTSSVPSLGSSSSSRSSLGRPVSEDSNNSDF